MVVQQGLWRVGHYYTPLSSASLMEAASQISSGSCQKNRMPPAEFDLGVLIRTFTDGISAFSLGWCAASTVGVGPFTEREGSWKREATGSDPKPPKPGIPQFFKGFAELRQDLGDDARGRQHLVDLGRHLTDFKLAFVQFPFEHPLFGPSAAQ